MTTGEKMATSVVGIILARYVTPALVAIALAMGTFTVNGLFSRIDGLAQAQVDIMRDLVQQSIRITAIEARRDASSVALDADLSQLLAELAGLRTKLDTTTSTVASMGAKVDILVSRLGPSIGVQ